MPGAGKILRQCGGLACIFHGGRVTPLKKQNAARFPLRRDKICIARFPLTSGKPANQKNQAVAVAPNALMALVRRLLWRAALFLWMIFLSAIESMVLTLAW